MFWLPYVWHGVNSSTLGYFMAQTYSAQKGRMNSNRKFYVLAWCADVPPTVSETKLNFLKAYKRPIPSIYNTVLQELIVQQHLMKYKRSYRYDPVFALGFVTIYDKLMEGYPSDEDRDAIFQAYIKALKEDPEQYRLEHCVIIVMPRNQQFWTRLTNSFKTHDLDLFKYSFHCCILFLQFDVEATKSVLTSYLHKF